MFRTRIATTEDIDNASFFASASLEDLLRGEIDFDWDDGGDADAEPVVLS